MHIKTELYENNIIKSELYHGCTLLFSMCLPRIAMLWEALLVLSSVGSTVWCRDSSVTAVIHSIRFVDNVSIRPPLQ